jgi:hypothetical protein
MWIRKNKTLFLRMDYFTYKPRREVQVILVSDDCTVTVYVSEEGREETRKYILTPMVYARLKKRLLRVAVNLGLSFAEQGTNVRGNAYIKVRSCNESESPISGYNGARIYNKVYDIIDKQLRHRHYVILEPEWKIISLMQRLNRELNFNE